MTSNRNLFAVGSRLTVARDSNPEVPRASRRQFGVREHQSFSRKTARKESMSLPLQSVPAESGRRPNPGFQSQAPGALQPRTQNNPSAERYKTNLRRLREDR